MRLRDFHLEAAVLLSGPPFRELGNVFLPRIPPPTAFSELATTKYCSLAFFVSVVVVAGLHVRQGDRGEVDTIPKHQAVGKMQLPPIPIHILKLLAHVLGNRQNHSAMLPLYLLPLETIDTLAQVVGGEGVVWICCEKNYESAFDIGCAQWFVVRCFSITFDVSTLATGGRTILGIVTLRLELLAA